MCKLRQTLPLPDRTTEHNMRIELAILAALGTMACTAQADGLSPSVEDATNMSVQLQTVPTLQDIASKPTADADPLFNLESREIGLEQALLIDGTTQADPFQGDPCPPCGRG